PDQISPPNDPPQPTTHRPQIRAQPRRDPPIPLPGHVRLDRRADHPDLVLPARQRQIRQQHMRTRAAPAPRPPRPQQPIPQHAAQNPLPSMPPRPQHPRTRQTPKQPADQLRLDQLLLSTYDQHGVPPPASREPSRRNDPSWREGSHAFTNARSLPPQAPSPQRTARASPPVLKLGGAQRASRFLCRRLDVSVTVTPVAVKG